MLRPKALDHVGLTVTDMDDTLRFYQQLGGELLRTSGPNADGVRSAVIKVGGQELNVFSRAGLVPVDMDKLAGVHHVCLQMEAASIDEVVADLRSCGLDIVRGPVQRSDGMAVFVHDPDGVKVELLVKSRTTA